MILKTFLVLILLVKVTRTKNPWDGPHVYQHRLPFNWHTTNQTIEVVADLENKIYTGNTTITARAEVDLVQEFRLNAHLTGDPEILLIEHISCKNGVSNIDISDVKVFSLEERQEFGFKISKPENFRFRRGDVLTVKLGFRSKVYESLKYGIYRPNPANKSVVTHFQPAYARTFIPCFDEPKYRAYFTLSMKVKGDADKYLILSNMPGNLDTDSGWHRFEQTKISIPVYLVAFAILDKSEYVLVHSFSYSGKPINLYTTEQFQNANGSFLKQSFDKLSNLGPEKYTEGKEDAKMLETAMTEAFSWCESHFAVKFIWVKMDFLIINTSFPGAMEHPGLVPLGFEANGLRKTIDTLSHEIIHQWAGVPLTTDSYDSMWINEGVTTYVNAKFEFDLYEKHRNIPYGYFPNLGMMFFYANRNPISLIDFKINATESPSSAVFPYLSHIYYFQSANILANLDDIMGSTLIQG